MAKIYYDKDADLKLLKDKMIGIIGYGSQGHAHSQNLRESGCQVIVGEVKKSPGWKNAEAAGFRVVTAADNAIGLGEPVAMVTGVAASSARDLSKKSSLPSAALSGPARK